MSHLRIRLLCVLYVGVAALSILSSTFNEAIPKDVVEAAGQLHAGMPEWMIWIVFVLGIIMLLVMSVGIVGLFLVRAWSRYWLLAMTLLMLISNLFFSWTATSGIEGACDQLHYIVLGVLLYSSFSLASQQSSSHRQVGANVAQAPI